MAFNRLSSFAAGIFLATSVCSVAYFTVGTEAAKAPDKTAEKKVETIQPSEEEMKARLESSGFIVQTAEEYDKHLNDAKEAAQKEAADDKKVVREVLLNVTDGMTSIDVGRMLEKAKLVDDAFKFTKAVEKKGVENRLRPGVYKVDSEMSRDQIIAAIFK
jgi:hypothetical protein